jgi:hypothetical protein
LLAAGRREEARAALGEAETVAAGTESTFVRFAIARARGEVLTREGKGAEALAIVAPPLEEAVNKGYVGEALELRLVRVAALLAVRRPHAMKDAKKEAMKERDAVDKEAARLGFGWVTKRAQAIAVR